MDGLMDKLIDRLHTYKMLRPNIEYFGDPSNDEVELLVVQAFVRCVVH
jgi:hypothetical protein